MEKLTVSILDFGAVPNSSEVQTDEIQAAIDHCFKAGGGEVIVPTGTFITGDIRIRNNVTLHLLENSVIKGSKNPQDYTHIFNDTVEPLPEDQNTQIRWISPKAFRESGLPFKRHLYTAGSFWNYGLIRAVYAENIAIIGEKGATIDGSNIYDPEGEEKYRGPHAINMHFCKNITFKGYKVINSSNWAHAIFQSGNITFKNLTVLGGHDALHTRKCTDILMEDCNLETGDDAIAGFGNENVVVRNCEISSACSAFRFGGNNILVEKCRMFAPCKYQFRGSFTMEEKISGVEVSENGRNNMLSFFTYFVTNDLPDNGKIQGNMVVRDCVVENADKMLHINLSGNETWQVGSPPTDITFENIKATGLKGGFTAYGDGKVFYELNLNNIDFSYDKDYSAEPFMQVANYGKINFNNVNIEGYNGNAFIKTWSDGGEIIRDGLNCEIKEGEFVVKIEEPFQCKRI